MKTWIQSASGLRVDPLDLKPEQVNIGDIAHALAQKCRFTGHTVGFYSVARHCITGSYHITPAFALAFLLHEVSEAYLPDIARPVKPHVHVSTSRGAMPWRDLEAWHSDVIFASLGLASLRTLIDSSEVKDMDLRMLATEKRDIMAPEPESWGLTHEPVSAFIRADRDTDETRMIFLNRFKQLTEVP